METNDFHVRRTVLSVLEQCSTCNAYYSIDDARVIERQGELWVLSIRCSHCQTQALVAAVIDGAVAEVETFDRAPLAPSDEPLNVDDVLDMHRFLETFDGDFHALFSRRGRRA